MSPLLLAAPLALRRATSRKLRATNEAISVYFRIYVYCCEVPFSLFIADPRRRKANDDSRDHRGGLLACAAPTHSIPCPADPTLAPLAEQVATFAVSVLAVLLLAIFACTSQAGLRLARRIGLPIGERGSRWQGGGDNGEEELFGAGLGLLGGAAEGGSSSVVRILVQLAAGGPEEEMELDTAGLKTVGEVRATVAACYAEDEEAAAELARKMVVRCVDEERGKRISIIYRCACVYVCTCVCARARVCVCVRVYVLYLYIYIYIIYKCYMCVCIYIYIYIYVCIYIYIYIYIYVGLTS